MQVSVDRFNTVVHVYILILYKRKGSSETIYNPIISHSLIKVTCIISTTVIMIDQNNKHIRTFHNAIQL